MMALLHVNASVEDLGYLTEQQKSSGDLKFYVYLSVIDSNGQPVTGLSKQDIRLIMFDGIETITLDQEFEIQTVTSHGPAAVPGFYGLKIDRKLKNETVLPEARLFGVTVKNGGNFGQTIFKVSYLKQ
jgi:hypothetical protein